MKAHVELVLLIALGLAMRWGREIAGGLLLVVLAWLLYIAAWAISGSAW